MDICRLGPGRRGADIMVRLVWIEGNHFDVEFNLILAIFRSLKIIPHAPIELRYIAIRLTAIANPLFNGYMNYVSKHAQH